MRALLIDHVTAAQLDLICELADIVRDRVEALDAQPREGNSEVVRPAADKQRPA